METQSAADLSVMPQCVTGLETRDAGNEQLVHDPLSGNVHVLNAMAARVLQRCDGATPLARIVGDLVSTTGVDPVRAAVDVVKVCEDFRKIGLLK